MARQETLHIPHDRMPELTLREVSYRSISLRPGELYQVELTAHGFEATRGLDVEDIKSIRDWCNEAIAKAEALSTQTLQAAE